MKKKYLIKLISFLSVFCLLFTSALPVSPALAVGTAPLEQQKAELEKKLRATEEKLKELGKESRDTEEYIEVLDEKISYLNKQYSLAKSDAKSLEGKVEALEINIANNENEINSIETDITLLEKNIKALNDQFSGVYKEYCERLRAIYVSGSNASTLIFLLSSGGLSNLLTRYQMVSAVSKRDGELLENVRVQTTEIVNTKNRLDDKKAELSKTQKRLTKSKSDLKAERVSLLQKQEVMASQQAEIEIQQSEANKLLRELHEKTKEYGEYRDITQEELDAIDADIEAADKKYPAPSTTAPTTATTTTTKRSQGSTESTKKDSSTTTTTTKSESSKYISLTYPCPKFTTITCGFGAYSGHTGADFSTHGLEDQKIVASESGTVILVKLLDYSYGHYIVIRHDKTTSSGKTVYTLYAHNNDIIVSEGQYVKKGQQIAYSGTTGNSTGPHCHFEVRVGGSGQSYAVNPENYLP